MTLADSPTAAKAAKALSFFGKMITGGSSSRVSEMERREARLVSMVQSVSELHESCLLHRAALEQKRQETFTLLSQCLEKLEKLSVRMTACMTENMRKVCIYLSSRFANGQYDTQMLSNMLERIDGASDRALFVTRVGRRRRSGGGSGSGSGSGGNKLKGGRRRRTKSEQEEEEEEEEEE